ncbi:hypothetical protein OE88DRAFT_1807370 [Heliocybe sulcata]|uniref:Telomere-associated protein Rif1 N-terminal domain-containing protein n=1 Tax=Heliocybe sulcata TaxID=5364 RepID=A0A5C3N4W7_9AGAM|nr:hypothetical protein OE88DRAFT_1807370 [Heliocybe sulcata]
MKPSHHHESQKENEPLDCNPKHVAQARPPSKRPPIAASSSSSPLKPSINPTMSKSEKATLRPKPPGAMPPQNLPTPTSSPQRPDDATAHTLESPVEVLLLSQRNKSKESPTVCDIADAYDTLVVRIRNIPLARKDPASVKSFLKPLEANRLAIVGCLRRDISRGKQVSTGGRPQQQVSSTPHDKSAYSSKEVDEASDSVACLHSGIKFLSVVFALPMLHSIFAANNLGSLLDVLVDVLAEVQMPTVNAQKTFVLIMWTLQRLGLPPDILAGKAQRISDALRATLRNVKVVDDVGTAIVCQCLKVVQELLIRHPAGFLGPFVDLVPTLLSCLCSTSHKVRHQAAMTLGRYAISVVDLPISASQFTAQHRRRLSHIAGTYMASQWRQYSKRAKGSQRERFASEVSLPGLILCTSSSDDPDSGCDLYMRPVWAASVVCSLILLVDTHLFRRSGVLEMAWECISPMIVRDDPVMKNLHPLVWKCITWAFSRIGTDPPEQTEENKECDQLGESVFMEMKADLRAYMGSDLIAYLRARSTKLAQDSLAETSVATAQDPESESTIPQVLIVLTDMVHSKDAALATEALATLKVLVSTIGYSHTSAAGSLQKPWSAQKLVERRLLNATMLLMTDEDTLEKFLRDRRTNDASKDSIAPFSEADIAEHWDQIFGIWDMAVQTCVQGTLSASVEDDMAFIWQSLLLVQSQLTQGHGHLTTDPQVVSRISQVFPRLLRFAVKLPDKTAATLRFLHRIWGMVTNVFSASLLPQIAGDILPKFLEIEIASGSEDEKSAGGFCAALLHCGDPPLMKTIAEHGIIWADAYQRRETWVLLARRLHNISCEVQDMIALAVLPFRCWEVTLDDLTVWDSLVQLIVARSKALSMQSLYALDEICKTIETVTDITRKSFMPRVVSALLQHADLAAAGALPATFLSMVDRVLASVYEPDSPGHQHAYELLQAVGSIIDSTPPELVPKLIGGIHMGLVRWIQDGSNLISEEDYNANVISLYTRALAALGELPATMDLLDDMAEFLASGFCCVPSPALGPTAFATFWQGRYSNVNNIQTACPEPLKPFVAVLFGPGSPDKFSQLSSIQRSDHHSPFSSPCRGTSTPLYAQSISLIKSFTVAGNVASEIQSPSLPVTSRSEDSIDDGTTISIHAHFLSPLKQVRPLGDSSKSNCREDACISPPTNSTAPRHMEVPHSSSSPSSSPLAARVSRKGYSFSEAPSRSSTAAGQFKAVNTGRKRSFAFPAPRDSAARLGRCSSYDQAGPHANSSGLSGNRLDFSAMPTPRQTSPASFAGRMTRAGGPGKRALPLASPFEERPPKRSKMEEDSEAGTSLTSKHGDSMVLDQTAEISDAIETSSGLIFTELRFTRDTELHHLSGWAEMPPTQGTDAAEDQILTIWDRTKVDASNVADVLDSNSMSLGGSLPPNRRSQTAPADSSHSAPAEPPPLRRSCTTPPLSSSRHLETLRETYLQVSDKLSDMAVQDLVEAQGLISKLGWKLNEELGKRLGGISE